jgi:enoyl-CoA hydratase
MVRVERAGPVTTLVLDRPEARNAVDRDTAVALAAEIAAFPPRCVLSDRRSAYESAGAPLDAALRREFELGKATIDGGESREGAARFASGAGRHGVF